MKYTNPVLGEFSDLTLRSFELDRALVEEREAQRRAAHAEAIEALASRACPEDIVSLGKRHETLMPLDELFEQCDEDNRNQKAAKHLAKVVRVRILRCEIVDRPEPTR